jgi:hypothetical protein
MQMRVKSIMQGRAISIKFVHVRVTSVTQMRVTSIRHVKESASCR